jgi:S1-C subfamily serine protease
MKRVAQIAVPVAALLLAGSAWAGGKECEKAEGAKHVAHAKCSASASECKQMMAESRSRGWIGLQVDQSDDGVLTVKSVYEGSPAEQAGFKAGDVLVTMNGIALEKAQHDKLKAAKAGLKPGDTITYTIRRSGAEQTLAARLAPMPDPVYTAMVEEHMKEHSTVASR